MAKAKCLFDDPDSHDSAFICELGNRDLAYLVVNNQPPDGQLWEVGVRKKDAEWIYQITGNLEDGIPQMFETLFEAPIEVRRAFFHFWVKLFDWLMPNLAATEREQLVNIQRRFLRKRVGIDKDGRIVRVEWLKSPDSPMWKRLFDAIMAEGGDNEASSRS